MSGDLDEGDEDDDDDSLYTGQSTYNEDEHPRKDKGKGRANDEQPGTSSLLNEHSYDEEEEEEDYDYKDDDNDSNEEENEEKDRDAMRSLVEDDGDNPYLLYKDMTKNVQSVISEISNQPASSNLTVATSSAASSSSSSDVQYSAEESKFEKSNEEPTQSQMKDKSVDDFWANMNQNIVKAKNNFTPNSITSSTPSTVLQSSTSSNVSTSKSTSDVDDFFASMLQETSSPAKISKPVTVMPAQNVTLTTQNDVAAVAPQKDVLKEKSSRLDALLNKMQNKKETTIKQSQKDWEEFKNKEGISEELKHAAKDGFLEKQAFLGRTEMRQFDKDAALRNQERERQRWEGK